MSMYVLLLSDSKSSLHLIWMNSYLLTFPSSQPDQRPSLEHANSSIKKPPRCSTVEIASNLRLFRLAWVTRSDWSAKYSTPGGSTYHCRREIFQILAESSLHITGSSTRLASQVYPLETSRAEWRELHLWRISRNPGVKETYHRYLGAWELQPEDGGEIVDICREVNEHARFARTNCLGSGCSGYLLLLIAQVHLAVDASYSHAIYSALLIILIKNHPYHITLISASILYLLEIPSRIPAFAYLQPRFLPWAWRPFLW